MVVCTLFWSCGVEAWEGGATQIGEERGAQFMSEGDREDKEGGGVSGAENKFRLEQQGRASHICPSMHTPHFRCFHLSLVMLETREFLSEHAVSCVCMFSEYLPSVPSFDWCEQRRDQSVVRAVSQK